MTTMRFTETDDDIPSPDPQAAMNVAVAPERPLVGRD